MSWDSLRFGGSCVCTSPLMGDVVPESLLTELLGEGGGAAVATFRFTKPGLVLTDPGATLADAGLTLTGLVLMGGLEQMEDWGADFSVTVADFSSGCRGTSDKR